MFKHTLNDLLEHHINHCREVQSSIVEDDGRPLDPLDVQMIRMLALNDMRIMLNELAHCILTNQSFQVDHEHHEHLMELLTSSLI